MPGGGGRAPPPRRPRQIREPPAAAPAPDRVPDSRAAPSAARSSLCAIPRPGCCRARRTEQRRADAARPRCRDPAPAPKTPPNASCAARRVRVVEGVGLTQSSPKPSLSTAQREQLHQIGHNITAFNKLEAGGWDIGFGLPIKARTVSPCDPRLPNARYETAQPVLRSDVFQQPDQSSRLDDASEFMKPRRL